MTETVTSNRPSPALDPISAVSSHPFLLISGVLVCGLGAFLLGLANPKYEAEGLLQIGKLFLPLESLSPSAVWVEDPKSVQVRAQSEPFQHAVRNRLAPPMREHQTTFRDAMKVSLAGEYVRLSYRSSDPEIAALVVKEACEEILEKHLQKQKIYMEEAQRFQKGIEEWIRSIEAEKVGILRQAERTQDPLEGGLLMSLILHVLFQERPAQLLELRLRNSALLSTLRRMETEGSSVVQEPTVPETPQGISPLLRGVGGGLLGLVLSSAVAIVLEFFGKIRDASRRNA